MPTLIKKIDTLTSHGNVEGRRTVLTILEAGLKAADPYSRARRLIAAEGCKLIIGVKDMQASTSEGKPITEPLIFDLSKVKNIYVVGGGKAAQRQAKAIEDVLGDLITEGQVNAKKGEQVQLSKIGVTLAGHPLPDEDSVEGSKKILEILRKARKDDIVFFSESGGSSSLMALPAPGLTIEDVKEVTRKLYFECGASMWDTNVVRWNLAILRGREKRYVGEATLIVFSCDERPPGIRVNLRSIQGHGSYQDAINILKKYDLWDQVPQRVREHLLKADPEYETLRPEELIGRPHYHFRVIGPEHMLEAAKREAERLRVNTTVIVSSLSDIEARAAGETLAYMAQEVETYGRPLKTPCVLICGGELLVKVGDKRGLGGRNQEFVLATAPRIAKSKNIVIASADSDGTDGPTDAAGGIVDGYTWERAEREGLDISSELDDHNSYGVLSKLNDLVFTGAQGTNVQDLRLIYIGGRTKVVFSALPEYLRTLIPKVNDA